MARPRQVSDEEILVVARECFMHDPSASTVTIAQRLGLSQAALFKRFGTKMRLMLAAMGIEDGPPWKAIADAGPDDRPLHMQLVALGGEINRFFNTLVPRVMALKAVGVDFGKMFCEHDVPPPVAGFHALRDFFQRALDDGRIRGGDPGGYAIAFIGMFQGRAFWRHVAASQFPSPMPDEDAYVRHVVDVFWRGVAPVEGECAP